MHMLHRLASAEGIVVPMCVCVSAKPRLHARRISLRGEGNALYPVTSSYYYYRHHQQQSSSSFMP